MKCGSEEEWRIIAEWPDYEVSNLSSVRRRIASYQPHWQDGSPSLVSPAGYVLRGGLATGGYRNVHLRRDGISMTKMVYELVCVAFHGQRPSPHHQVAHYDGDPTNDRADNLRWATPKENAADKVRHGRSLRGTKQHLCKLNEEQVREIRRRIARGELQARVAADCGVSRPTVSAIVNRRNWSWLDA